MDKPLVSILTITRNRGDLLKRCITSVLSQTYENIEHIVVDGASDDNTDEVVAEIRDKRLKFHKLDYNWPLKETMEYGLSLCEGKYLSFLDSDDEYLPTKIEKQVNLLESLSDDYGFVYCWMSYYDSGNNNSLIRLHNPQLKGNVAKEVVARPIVTGTPTLLFKTDFFRKLGGWKSVEEIGIASDWELCARACQIAKVDYVPESLVNVYVNHGSVRQSNRSYYSGVYERNVKFHNYFLNTYSSVFSKEPNLAAYHYFALSRNAFLSRHYCESARLLIKSLFLDCKFTCSELREQYKRRKNG